MRFIKIVSFFVLALVQALAQDMYSGVSTYSDDDISDDGNTIMGWVVTSACSSQATHYSDVETTLTSPLGRQAYQAYTGAGCSIRADLSLPFDENDLGYYTVSSVHRAHCPFYVSSWYFLITTSSASDQYGYSTNYFTLSADYSGAYPIAYCDYSAISNCNTRCYSPPFRYYLH